MTRPVDFSSQELGFRPQSPVSWLTPANTTSLFQVQLNPNSGFDTREVQAAIPAHTASYPEMELWFDFVGGAGDGFDATYSVAYLASKAELAVAGHVLPRAKLLILGGSLVQPVASWWGYRDRLVGPYSAAFPAEESPGSAHAMALPGPADWTDGLVAFRRTFANGDSLGARRLTQTRSYFGVELPGNWWLFALDIPPGGVLDAPQENYFLDAAKKLRTDSRVIVVVARPTWSDSHVWDPAGHDALDLFIEEVIRPTGAQVGLYLAGDDHHYARFAARSTDATAITCGGGGAYPTPTHRLPHSLEVPPPYSINLTSGPPEQFDLVMRHPDAATSRRMAWSLLTKLPLANRAYVVLLAVLQAGLMLTITAPPQTAKFAVPILVVTALAAVLMPGQVGSVSDLLQRATSFGIPVRDARLSQRVAIALHVLAQILLGLACASVWSLIPLSKQSGVWPLIWAFAVYAPVVGVIASLLGATYLIISSLFVRAYQLLNYAALGSNRHHCFLRMHIAASGDLTIYPISVDVCTAWRINPEGAIDEAWIKPGVDEPHVDLIETPIRISGG